MMRDLTLDESAVRVKAAMDADIKAKERFDMAEAELDAAKMAWRYTEERRRIEERALLAIAQGGSVKMWFDDVVVLDAKPPEEEDEGLRPTGA